MFRKFIVLILLIIGISAAFAIPPANFTDVIDGFILTARKDPKFAPARIGIVIQSLDDNTVWYSEKANESFIPASTAKLFIASLSFEYLPIDYSFSTQVYLSGSIVENELEGNIVLKGGGDPTLTYDNLEEMASILALGNPDNNIPPLNRITGRIILDGTAFPRPGPQLCADWEKDDLPWYYAAPASALSCNRNAVLVTVKGARSGKPPIVTVTPATKLFTVKNNAFSSDKIKAGSTEIVPKGSQLIVSGKLAPEMEFTEKVSVSDPEKFINEQFTNALSAKGIKLDGKMIQTVEAPLLIEEHFSSPLSEIIHGMLKESDNHAAEQLRWTLLARQRGDIPLEQRYMAICGSFFKKAGISSATMQLADGCGLSRGSRISPVDMVKFLAYAGKAPYADYFYESLPIAGIDGTMKKRLIGTRAEGNARVKTGTMRGVCTLAGYVTTTDGERLALAIFLNDYESGAAVARKLQDDIVSYLAGI